VSSNPTDGEVYLIKFYEIKFVSDLQQVIRLIDSCLLSSEQFSGITGKEQVTFDEAMVMSVMF
jgi:hypothetical protein